MTVSNLKHDLREAALPAVQDAHRTAPRQLSHGTAALERYLTYLGGLGDGASILSMLDDLADLFEQGAADGTPVREIVGEDPVEFAETFLQNYPKGQWISRERERLTDAIDRAAGSDA